MRGIYLFYKPPGISSAGFLDQIKRLSKIKADKVGHGGTLDPFAEGLLIVAFSREYTKTLSRVLKGSDKTYLVDVILGKESDTYDKTGKISDAFSGKLPSEEEVSRAVAVIAERKEQTPPPFSAVKIKGKPAYLLSRKGEKVDLKPKEVNVKRWKIIGITPFSDTLKVSLEMEVASGFYIRSFAHDLGIFLDVGGYVEKLVRTKVGEYNLKDALTLEQFQEESGR